MSVFYRTLGGAAIAILMAGCSATPDEAPDPRPDPPPADDGTSSGLLGGGPPPSESFAPLSTPLRRLTVAQYRNSLRDLLGPPVTLPDDLEPDTAVDGFASMGATKTALSAHATEQYADAAYGAARQILALEREREAFVGCAPLAPSDAECARRFVDRFGQRVFRRPLAEDEIARYVAIFEGAAPVTNDFHRALEYVAAALLQSPYFLYRLEVGDPDPDEPARRRLGPYEMATRLSYFLWNTTPDGELLAAASSGELATEEGLRRAIERLLAAPPARDAARNFFSEMLGLDRLDQLPQLPASFPLASATLGPAMREEMLLLFDDSVFARRGDYRELFDTRRSFVDGELAALYGQSPPAGGAFAPIELPDVRRGILSRAAFLALNGHASSTSPTKRGKFVREIALCMTIAPPPPNVNVALPTGQNTPQPKTLRERLATHSVNPVCASCHQALDPIGLGLEEFDGIGALRATEAGLPVVTAGRFDGVDFSGAAGLGAIVRDRPELGPCLVRNVFRYAVGRVETEGEDPVLAALARNFAARGYRVDALLAASVRSASFRYGGPLD